MIMLVGVKQAAKELGLSAFFLYRAAERTDIPVYRFGRALRFNVNEVKEWAKNRVSSSTNDSGSPRTNAKGLKHL
jgi:excisionase family DNA binding protein